MARNKIGFLRGSGGNGTGFSDYVWALDAAGIPAVVGAYDVTDGLLDVLALNSSVPHVLYYRVVRDGTEKYAVPQYHLSPAQAAKAHWDLIRPHIAKEVADNRDKVWIAPVNELDKNRYDWIGYFSIEIGKLMMAEGFKQIAIGSNAGEPEPEAWETPGMLAYLRECEKYPNSLGICLHEGSFTVDRMVWDGWTIGRFWLLHKACDRHRIKRPKIIIGEFGWSHRDIPPTDVAMQHIAAMSREYARYPNILGVGIWYLGKYTGDIANKVQQLIQPVTEFTLVTEFEDVKEQPMSEPREQYKRTYWVVPAEVSGTVKNQIYLQAAIENKTVGPSFDDAGLGVLNDKTAVIWNYKADKQVLVNWYAEHYPGTKVEFRDFQ